MRKLWIWHNGDYCVLEDGCLPLDQNGEFVDDEITRGSKWRELVEKDNFLLNGLES